MRSSFSVVLSLYLVSIGNDGQMVLAQVLSVGAEDKGIWFLLLFVLIYRFCSFHT